MAMPKADPATRKRFEDALPANEPVLVRPMFGNVAAFANGHMFAGVFGDAIFVRLPPTGRDAAVRDGARAFEPMPGRPMREYVELADAWTREGRTLRAWIKKGLATVQAMPPKKGTR